jgi:hypothetical protein
MATWSPITVDQGQAVTVVVVITPADPADDLTAVTAVEAVIKDRVCVADTAAGVVRLTTADPTQVLITAHTAASITAKVFIPATATNLPYDRVWRVDALIGTSRRTAAYGPMTVNDL